MPEGRRTALRWRGDLATEAARTGAAAGLREAADHLLTKAQDKVPVDSTELRESGRFDVDDAELKAAVSFDTAYAVVQHEDLDLAHPHGGQAKYLEEPSHTEREELRRLLAEQIRQALGTA